MNLGLEGTTALVTGSSSGLGKASAAALAEEGVDVMLNGRDESRLNRAQADLQGVDTGEVRTCAADLGQREHIQALVEQTVDAYGDLDHLVTSVGGPPGRQFAETSEEEWYETFDLLVMSVVRLVHEAAPHLRASSGGSIVNITSIVVKEANPRNVLSSAIRMGVVGLEKTLSRELAPEIRVNMVLPGAHDTPRVEELGQQAVEGEEYESVEDWLDHRTRQIPVGRLGEPRELGDMVAYLCSDRAGFINGVAIPIDGGAHRSNL